MHRPHGHLVYPVAGHLHEVIGAIADGEVRRLKKVISALQLPTKDLYPPLRAVID